MTNFEVNSAMTSGGPKSSSVNPGSKQLFDQQWNDEFKELSDQMVSHIVSMLKMYLTKFYSFHLSIQDGPKNRLERQKLSISEHRCTLLSNLI